MKEKSRLTIFLVLLTIFVFASEGQARKIRVAIPGYAISQVVFLASKVQGHYDVEGLEVELIAMRAPVANLAVLAGNVEFTTIPVAGLTAALRGGPLRVLFSTFDRPQHVVFAKPEIRNLMQLRGKKVAISGIGTIDAILVQEILKEHGLEGGRDVVFVGLGGAADRLIALTSGSVDAAVLVAPFNFKAKEAGFTELVSLAREKLVLPSGGVVVREDLLQSDSVLVESFLRGTFKGFLYARDNRAGTVPIIAKSLGTDQDLAGKIYDLARPTMTMDGTMSKESQRTGLELIGRMAGLKALPPSFEKLFNFSFIQKIRAELASKPGRSEK